MLSMEIVEFHANLRLQMYKTVVISEHRNMHMPTHAQHIIFIHSAELLSQFGLFLHVACE